MNKHVKEDNYLDVVAPPIRSGSFIPILSISLATNIISSSDGVINPDRPTISKKIKFNLLIQTITGTRYNVKP